MTIAVISMIRDSWGGSEELWYEMGKHALKQGHKLIHVGYETPIKHAKIQELESLGMVRYNRPGWIPPTSSATAQKLYLAKNYLRKKFNSQIKKLFAQDPDIIIYNGTCYSIAQEKELLNYLQVKRPPKFYIIGHLNNQFNRGISEEEANRVRLAYQLCKKVFFVSQRSLDVAKRQLAIDIPNAEIIKNPVNLSSLSIIPFPSTEGTIQLACVGNLVSAHKGQDILFETLSKWREQDWILNIYGNGFDKDYLERLSKQLKLDNKIIFHGSVKDIRKLWEQNHVLIMPSIMEGIPLALVEAMICGRICVATDVGGISEWIVDSENGFLVGAPAVKLLLEALDKAWRVKSKWPDIASNAHAAALKLYDPDPGLTLLNKIIG